MQPSRGICQACCASGLRSLRTRSARTESAFKASVSSSRRSYLTNIHPSPIRPPHTLLQSRNTSPTSLSSAASQKRLQSTWPATGVNTQSPLSAESIPDLTPEASEFVPGVASKIDEQLLSGGLGSTWDYGYLKSLGLDFGWGPTSMMERLFELVHINSGLVLGGSIMLTALTVRLCFFPLLRMSADQSARLRAVSTFMKPIRDKMKVAMQSNDQMAFAQHRQELVMINKAAGIQIWKMFLPFVQIPFGFGSWRLFRNMAEVPVPGMQTGGFLWFQNLSLADPYLILPVTTALFQHLTIRFGGEAGEGGGQARMRWAMLYVMPPIVVCVTSWIPAAVQLSFAVTAILSTITSAAFRNANMRKLLRMAPNKMVKPETTSYKGTINVSGRVQQASTKATSNGQQGPSGVSRSPSSMSDRLSKFRPPNIKSLFTDAKNKVMGFRDSASDQMDQRKAKKVKERAGKYEDKRRKEIDDERREFEKNIKEWRVNSGGRK